MIRKLMAIFYFLAINISCVYANDIGVDNYQYECRIGPIGVHDTFDMNQLNMQHFTTFMLPRKLTKPVYTRPALSPLDFLRFGL